MRICDTEVPLPLLDDRPECPESSGLVCDSEQLATKEVLSHKLFIQVIRKFLAFKTSDALTENEAQAEWI